MSRLLLLKHTSWLAAATLLAFSQLSSASPISCGPLHTTESATANGAYADDCHFETGLSDNGDDTVLAHLNALSWADDGMFSYIGRYEKDPESFKSPEPPNYDPGFTLTVAPSSDGFAYSYQLVVPEAWIGTKVDWVLGVKQASDSYMSYLFKDVTLGIEGGFNNFWVNSKGNNPNPTQENKYSYAAGFIREVATVPETSTFLLMLTGLLGLAATRRRIRKSA
ncbi:PEP-CTERM sorting domain-containing protein [Marinimicrobium alkaliphilum]|uniref:PEP-CTERM sorting domain-containing protein n=1 Tax=Marinimicrobium alkaliphilum TaxID=2202654 RepID=UPI00130063D6|nr:PEP-CTERM sorting domain-containing protein [Marinimicrobium alkaliphilum]